MQHTGWAHDPHHFPCHAHEQGGCDRMKGWGADISTPKNDESTPVLKAPKKLMEALPNFFKNVKMPSEVHTKYSSGWPTIIVAIECQNPNMYWAGGPGHRSSHLPWHRYWIEEREREVALGWWKIIFLTFDGENPLTLSDENLLVSIRFCILKHEIWYPINYPVMILRQGSSQDASGNMLIGYKKWSVSFWRTPITEMRPDPKTGSAYFHLSLWQIQ